MSAAWSALADGSITKAASILTDMMPILGLIGGIALGAWVAGFLLSVARGGS